MRRLDCRLPLWEYTGQATSIRARISWIGIPSFGLMWTMDQYRSFRICDTVRNTLGSILPGQLEE